MSWRYMFLSTSREAPKRCVNSPTLCSNLPDHSAMKLSSLRLTDTKGDPKVAAWFRVSLA